MYCIDGDNFIRCGLKEGDKIVIEILKTDDLRYCLFLSFFSSEKKLYSENDTNKHKQFLGIFSEKQKLNDHLNYHLSFISDILGLSLEIGPKSETSLHVVITLKFVDVSKPRKYFNYI